MVRDPITYDLTIKVNGTNDLEWMPVCGGVDLTLEERKKIKVGRVKW